MLLSTGGLLHRLWAPAAQPGMANLPLRRRVQCATHPSTYAMQLCYLPTSNRLGVVCSDAAVRLYDPSQLLFAGQCKGHTERVNDLAPAGEQLLVSCSDDGTTKLWDTRTSACAHTLGGLGAPPVRSACADEAGLLVATGGEGGVVQLWDVRTASLRQTYYDLHTDDLVRVRFQPGAPGPRLLSAADDGLVSITEVSVADVDDALVDCLSVGSAIDDFGFFGSTAEDTGVWVCCSDQRFELWSLALPPAEEDMMSEGPPRLMQFPDARPAVTELLRPFGGIGGGVAVHPERLPTSAAAGDDDMDASVEDEVSAILSVFLSNREPGRNVYLPPVSPWLRVLKAESALYRNTGP